jgi:hypothetical protein
LLDNNFKQSLLDLFISFKSRVVFMYKGPWLDIIAKDSMLDWTAYSYKEIKLDTKLITSLGRDMLLTLLRFSPSIWVPQPLLFSSLLQPSRSPHKFSSKGC